MFIIFTGNGKGKTTAALGQALRAVGDGKRVLMIQFIKGPWRSGEDESHVRLNPLFKIVKMGKGFVGIGKDPLPRKEHERAAKEALHYAQKETLSENWEVVILDEINNALHLGLVGIEEVMDFVEKAALKLEHLIFTGRDCPPELITRADLVTEMTEIKHPFRSGVAGAKGLEY